MKEGQSAVVNKRDLSKYIGKTCGVLTVLQIDSKYEDKAYKFKDIICLCKCSLCGKESEVKLNSLLTTTNKELVCCDFCWEEYKIQRLRKKYKGLVKGVYKCLDYDHTDKNNRHWVKAQCLQCGNIVVKPIHYFNSPAHEGSKSCPNCRHETHIRLSHENAMKRHKASTEEEYAQMTKIRAKFSEYKQGAKARDIEYHLSLDESKKLFLSNCAYCGQPLSFGIDRIDSTKHYTTDNTVPCCAMCNRMKNAYSKEVFLNKIKEIYLHSIVCNSTTIPEGSTSEANAGGSTEHPKKDGDIV